MKRGLSDLEYFLDRVEKRPDGCWIWTGSHESDGYGLYVRGTAHLGTRRNGFAHRLAYELFVGPIPERRVIDHLCRVRDCVNPEHLEVVTHAQNMSRIPAKTHCKRGHEYTPENTYYTTSGSYYCRDCHRATNLIYWRERRSKEKAQRAVGK